MTNLLYNIICGDSIKIMKSFDDKSFDLCLTDPPYNVNCNYDKYNDSKSHDDYLNFSQTWFAEAKRIANTIVFTPGNKNLKMWLTKIEYPKEIVMLYIPNQSSSSFSNGFSHWEPILCYGKIKLRKTAIHGIIARQNDIGNHPCPKNFKIWENIFKNVYPKPKSVIDPFLGSGTSATVSKKHEVKTFVGIDISNDYCQITNKRLNKYQNLTLMDFF